MAQEPNTDRDRPGEQTLAGRIANDLRKTIECGEYSAGDRLPSGRALMRKYGVARQTVQNAFDALRSEGLIVTRVGAGAFVRGRPIVLRLARNRLSRRARTAGRAPFLSDAAISGFVAAVDVTIRTEPADPRVASALDLTPGDSVLVRERVMTADRQPTQLASSRLPRRITEGTAIEQDDTGPGGIYARLEEAGHTLDHFIETVSTRPASPTEATALRVEPATPVLYVTRIAFDHTSRPIEVNDMVLAGDRYELVYELPAE